MRPLQMMELDLPPGQMMTLEPGHYAVVANFSTVLWVEQDGIEVPFWLSPNVPRRMYFDEFRKFWVEIPKKPEKGFVPSVAYGLLVPTAEAVDSTPVAESLLEPEPPLQELIARFIRDGGMNAGLPDHGDFTEEDDFDETGLLDEDDEQLSVYQHFEAIRDGRPLVDMLPDDPPPADPPAEVPVEVPVEPPANT